MIRLRSSCATIHGELIHRQMSLGRFQPCTNRTSSTPSICLVHLPISPPQRHQRTQSFHSTAVRSNQSSLLVKILRGIVGAKPTTTASFPTITSNYPTNSSHRPSSFDRLHTNAIDQRDASSSSSSSSSSHQTPRPNSHTPFQSHQSTYHPAPINSRSTNHSHERSSTSTHSSSTHEDDHQLADSMVDNEVYATAENAKEIIRLERAYFARDPDTRDPFQLLARMNEYGFHRRAIDICTKLTPREKEKFLAKQQIISAMLAVVGTSGQRGTHPRTHQPSTPPPSHSTPVSPPTANIKNPYPVLAATPTGSLTQPTHGNAVYVSKIGSDPSRVREYIIYEDERKWRRRKERIAALLILGGIAFAYTLWEKRNLTPEERIAREHEWEEMLKQLKASLTQDTSIGNKIPIERPTTRLRDVVGCDEAKSEVVEVIEYLKDPSKFNRLGGKMPKGVLLLGPPGTGKTLLARAIAGEAGVPFFAATGADFEEKYVGVGSKRVRELFIEAKKHKPAIIFIDEIDTIGGKRSPEDYTEGWGHNETLNQLLTELDGFKDLHGVIVIGATNFANKLDPALLRPGRFDRHVIMNPPDIKGRRALLEYYGKKIKLGPQVDLTHIARTTPGMTGAEIAQLVNTAALHAASKNQVTVGLSDFEYAKDHLVMGAARISAVNTPEIRQHISIYEGGKSIVALRTPHARPIHKVTIIQRGHELGQTSQTQSTDTDITSEDYTELLAMMDFRMGGRVAEELTFGPSGITSHGDEDLRIANLIARTMVMQWGFNDERGPVSDTSLEQFAVTASPDAKERVDHEVKKLLDKSYQRTKALLEKNKSSLKRVSEGLLQHDTLDAEQLKQLAGQQDD